MLAHDGDEELYRGRVGVWEGDRGYSELTPGSGPVIEIWNYDFDGNPLDDDGERTVDLVDRLEELDGQTVHLPVDDGPACHAS